MIKKGASAVILWREKILLFHRDNIPTISNPDCLQLPGGTVEQGETTLQALKRELTEEVSYVPKIIIFVKKIKTDNGDTYVYFCPVNDSEAKKFKHGPGEGQEIGFFSLEEALGIKLTPLLRDAFEKANSLLEKGASPEDVITKII